MFLHSVLFAYGRHTITESWYVDAAIGINRLYYIHSGSVTFRHPEGDITLTPGNLYLLPQNLEFQPVFPLLSPVDHSYFDFITVGEIDFSSFLCIKPTSDAILSHALDFAISVTNAHQTGDGFALAKTALDALLYSLLNAQKLKPVHHNRLESVLNYISEHYSDDITLEQLSDICFLSKKYFIRYFCQQTGFTPYQYIKKIRLTHAISQLRSGHTLQKIAESVGYESASALSKAIKKEYGKSPEKFRQTLSPDSFLT